MIGSIKVGKNAEIALFVGDQLDICTRASVMFIDGVRRVLEKISRLYGG